MKQIIFFVSEGVPTLRDYQEIRVQEHMQHLDIGNVRGYILEHRNMENARYNLNGMNPICFSTLIDTPLYVGGCRG